MSEQNVKAASKKSDTNTLENVDKRIKELAKKKRELVKKEKIKMGTEIKKVKWGKEEVEKIVELEKNLKSESKEFSLLDLLDIDIESIKDFIKSEKNESDIIQEKVE